VQERVPGRETRRVQVAQSSSTVHSSRCCDSLQSVCLTTQVGSIGLLVECCRLYTLREINLLFSCRFLLNLRRGHLLRPARWLRDTWVSRLEWWHACIHALGRWSQKLTLRRAWLQLAGPVQSVHPAISVHARRHCKSSYCICIDGPGKAERAFAQWKFVVYWTLVGESMAG
jgi:hypothetical protein